MVSHVTRKVYVTSIVWVEVECIGLTLTIIYFICFIFFTLSIWNLEGRSLICIDVVIIWVVRAIDCLAAKLERKFLTYDVMESLGVMYPQYWL